MPASTTDFTAGARASASTGEMMTASTPWVMKLSSWEACLSDMLSASLTIRRTLSYSATFSSMAPFSMVMNSSERFCRVQPMTISSPAAEPLPPVLASGVEAEPPPEADEPLPLPQPASRDRAIAAPVIRASALRVFIFHFLLLVLPVGCINTQAPLSGALGVFLSPSCPPEPRSG